MSESSSDSFSLFSEAPSKSKVDVALKVLFLFLISPSWSRSRSEDLLFWEILVLLLAVCKAGINKSKVSKELALFCFSCFSTESKSSFAAASIEFSVLLVILKSLLWFSKCSLLFSIFFCLSGGGGIYRGEVLMSFEGNDVGFGGLLWGHWQDFIHIQTNLLF